MRYRLQIEVEEQDTDKTTGGGKLKQWTPRDPIQTKVLESRHKKRMTTSSLWANTKTGQYDRHCIC